MTPGDVVLYSCAGQEHKAIVLHAHSGQVSHLGANGEPLLHLAFIAPERESTIERAKYGYIPRVFTEFDVVHHSHAFTEQFKKDNGLLTPAQIAAVRGQGEWRALVTADAELVNAAIDQHLAGVIDSAGEPVQELPESTPEPDTAPKE